MELTLREGERSREKSAGCMLMEHLITSLVHQQAPQHLPHQEEVGEGEAGKARAVLTQRCDAHRRDVDEIQHLNRHRN